MCFGDFVFRLSWKHYCPWSWKIVFSSVIETSSFPTDDAICAFQPHMVMRRNCTIHDERMCPAPDFIHSCEAPPHRLIIRWLPPLLHSRSLLGCHCHGATVTHRIFAHLTHTSPFYSEHMQHCASSYLAQLAVNLVAHCRFCRQIPPAEQPPQTVQRQVLATSGRTAGVMYSCTTCR